MNYYSVLGLKNTASQEEIKAAYKKLVKKYHPDIYTGDKTFAEKKTAEINVAYDVLSNPESKQEYDDSITPKYSYTPPKYDYNSNYSSYNNNNNYNSYNSYKGYNNSSNYNTYRSYNNNNNYRTYNTYSYKTYSTKKDGSEHDYSTYANYEKKYSDYHRSTTPNSNYTYYNDQFTDRITNQINRMSTSSQVKVWSVVMIIYFIVMIIFSVQLIDVFSKEDSDDNKVSSSQTYSSYSSKKNSNSSSTSVSTNSTTAIYNNSSLTEYFTKEEVLRLYNSYLNQTTSYISFEEFVEILEIYVTKYE